MYICYDQLLRPKGTNPLHCVPRKEANFLFPFPNQSLTIHFHFSPAPLYSLRIQSSHRCRRTKERTLGDIVTRVKPGFALLLRKYK
jgi:hypothetical protein